MIIPLMDFRTCKMVGVESKDIYSIYEGVERGRYGNDSATRDYPFSDVRIKNDAKDIDRIVRVVESKSYIERRIEECKNAEDE